MADLPLISEKDARKFEKEFPESKEHPRSCFHCKMLSSGHHMKVKGQLFVTNAFFYFYTSGVLHHGGTTTIPIASVESIAETEKKVMTIVAKDEQYHFSHFSGEFMTVLLPLTDHIAQHSAAAAAGADLPGLPEEHASAAGKHVKESHKEKRGLGSILHHVKDIGRSTVTHSKSMLSPAVAASITAKEEVTRPTKEDKKAEKKAEKKAKKERKKHRHDPDEQHKATSRTMMKEDLGVEAVNNEAEADEQSEMDEETQEETREDDESEVTEDEAAKQQISGVSQPSALPTPEQIAPLGTSNAAMGVQAAAPASGKKRKWLTSRFSSTSKQNRAAADKSVSAGSVSSSFAKKHRKSRSLGSNPEILAMRAAAKEQDELSRSTRFNLPSGSECDISIAPVIGIVDSDALTSTPARKRNKIGAKLDLKMKQCSASAKSFEMKATASAKSLEAKAQRKNPLAKLQRGKGSFRPMHTDNSPLFQALEAIDDDYFGSVYAMIVAVPEGRDINTSGASSIYCTLSVQDSTASAPFYTAKTNKTKDASKWENVFETRVFFDRVLKVIATVKAATTGPDVILGQTYVLVDKPEKFAAFDSWLPLLDPISNQADKDRGRLRVTISMAAVSTATVYDNKVICKQQTPLVLSSIESSQRVSQACNLKLRVNAENGTAGIKPKSTETQKDLCQDDENSGRQGKRSRLMAKWARPFAVKQDTDPRVTPSVDALATYFYRSGETGPSFKVPESALPDKNLRVLIPFVREFERVVVSKQLHLKHITNPPPDRSKDTKALPTEELDVKHFFEMPERKKAKRRIHQVPIRHRALNTAGYYFRMQVPFVKEREEDISDDEIEYEEEDLCGEEGKPRAALSGFTKLMEAAKANGVTANLVQTEEEWIAKKEEEKVVKLRAQKDMQRTKRDLAKAYKSLGLSPQTANKQLLTYTTNRKDWKDWRVRFNTAMGKGMSQLGVSMGEVQALELPVDDTWLYCEKKFGDVASKKVSDVVRKRAADRHTRRAAMMEKEKKQKQKKQPDQRGEEDEPKDEAESLKASARMDLKSKREEESRDMKEKLKKDPGYRPTLGSATMLGEAMKELRALVPGDTENITKVVPVGKIVDAALVVEDSSVVKQIEEKAVRECDGQETEEGHARSQNEGIPRGKPIAGRREGAQPPPPSRPAPPIPMNDPRSTVDRTAATPPPTQKKPATLPAEGVNQDDASARLRKPVGTLAPPTFESMHRVTIPVVPPAEPVEPQVVQIPHVIVGCSLLALIVIGYFLFF